MYSLKNFENIINKKKKVEVNVFFVYSGFILNQ